MKTALLFPGQGERDVVSHVRGALADQEPLLSHACEAMGCSAEGLLRSPSLLQSSRILQPVLTALSLASARRIPELDYRIDLVAGHSLGELSAWSYAGAVSPEEAVELAAVRGAAMTRSAEAHPGGMLAVGDLKDGELSSVLTSARRHGQIWIGAYNAPGETVLTGSIPALQAAASRCASRRLRVEGAWHSPLMKEAREELAAALGEYAAHHDSSCSSTATAIPVVSGVDGCCVVDHHEMPVRLPALMTQPLHWSATIRTLAGSGVERFMIAGPGRVLRYLLRCNLPRADIVMV